MHLTLDTVKRFADTAHRLTIFVPGFIPRAKFGTDLYPQMEQFANNIIAKQ